MSVVSNKCMYDIVRWVYKLCGENDKSTQSFFCIWVSFIFVYLWEHHICIFYDK